MVQALAFEVYGIVPPCTRAVQIPEAMAHVYGYVHMYVYIHIHVYVHVYTDYTVHTAYTMYTYM